MVEHLRWQADACDEPRLAVLRHSAATPRRRRGAAGITADVLRGHERSLDDLNDQALALRLLGGVHRLVLSGNAPALAAHYPSVGGDGDADAAVGPAPGGARRAGRPAVRDALGRAPQTNEVGRAAPLVGALCHLVDARPLPIRLIEIGASAGLNLRCDRFEIRTEDGRSYGPAGSPALLDRAWRGRIPPMDRALEMIERTGCDPHPLDPTSAGRRAHAHLVRLAGPVGAARAASAARSPWRATCRPRSSGPGRRSSSTGLSSDRELAGGVALDHVAVPRRGRAGRGRLRRLDELGRGGHGRIPAGARRVRADDRLRADSSSGLPCRPGPTSGSARANACSVGPRRTGIPVDWA